MIHLDPQLTFDKAAHRYYLGNTLLPSVTTVLAAAGLLDYGFLGDRREAYLERGRRVHVMTQRDDEGSLAEEPPDAEILGYVEAWRSFKRDYGFAPRLIEHRVFHPQLQYAGTLDRLGPVRDGSEWLLDIKTGIAPAAARLQLAAYNGCLRHPRARLRRCVELHQDGAYKVIPFETSDYQRDLNKFLEALETFRAREEEK
jgi:hypothetical protein